MTTAHYPALIAGYAVALLAWLVLNRWRGSPWPAAVPATFRRPWIEVGWVLLAGVAILAIGQLWVRGIRLPETGAAGPVLASINQVLIFAPVGALLLIRRQGPETAWLARARLAVRLLLGLLLAILAVAAYSGVRAGDDGPAAMLGRIVRYRNLDLAAQVFLEDVTIAVLFVRLSAAIGPRVAVGLAALLFAAGHVPSLLAGGATAGDLLPLALDASLGPGVLAVLLRSRDIVWFWCVHFAMDMTQFDQITFGSP